MKPAIAASAALLLLGPSANAVTHEVGPGKTFATVQAAIDGAADGDTIQVDPGAYPEDVLVNKPVRLLGAGVGATTISGPIGGDGATVRVASTGVEVAGFKITRAGNNPTDWNHPGLNSAGIAVQGQTGALIHDNLITGNRTAIDVNDCGGHVIRNNVLTDNRTGMLFRNQTDNLTVVENEITHNWTVGVLFLDASGGTNTPVQTARNSTFSNNRISGNWYGQIVDRQTGGSLPAPGANSKNFENNWFGTAAPSVSTANSSEPGYAAQIPVSCGGTATAPVTPPPDVLGPAAANLDIVPLLSSGIDTNVETAPGRGTYGFQGKPGSASDYATITANTAIIASRQYESLYVAPGATVTVGPAGSLTAAALNLGAGAVLEVNGGSLTIGGSTISGRFTFFNGFGSVDFDGDVAITGSAEGLILISDVHVADGATITVDGSLVIDGCVVDSTGNFDLVVNSGAKFTMVRTVFVNGDITLDSADTAIYDNRFEASTITVGTGATAARVYHNLTDDLGWLTGTAETTVDGWGNVTAAADTNNNLFLGLELGTLTSLTNGRTQDADGNVYVQPADAFSATLDVSKLQTRISALEVLLGYNTGMLTASTLSLDPDWNVLITGVNDTSAMIGKIDGAIGLSFDYPDPAGTDADQTIASANLVGKGIEGETVFFHRVKMASDIFGGETRLTIGGDNPGFLAPFTANSASILLDGTVPSIAADSSNGTQVQTGSPAPVNVLNPAAAPLTPNFTFRNGNPVLLTFTANDSGPAGLDAADAAADLTLGASNGITTLSSWTVVASADPLTGKTTYTVTLAVPATATTGNYTVTAAVRDRSGNWSTASNLGSFKIANEVLATVELQGFVGASRTVVFTGTDVAGAVLGTWTKTVTSFTGAVGTVRLENVPVGTAAISAKTAWNLRSRKVVGFSPEGVGAVSLTDADKLPGGDLNGDNMVTSLDYSIMRLAFPGVNPIADITGEGIVNTLDYLVFRGNWLTRGDPQ